MLKLRVLTAAVLIPLVVTAILLLPTLYIGLVFTVVMAMAAWEWAKLSGVRRISAMFGYIAILLLTGAAAEFLLIQNPSSIKLLLVAAFLWWLGVSVFIGFCRTPVLRQPGVSFCVLQVGAVTFILTGLTFGLLHGGTEKGPTLVLCCLLIVWAADIGAYFAGRRFGRTRLAPELSPGKSVEGVIGGLLAVVVVALGSGSLLGYSGMMLGRFVLLSIVVAVFSVVGDLFESWLKRRAGVKDSGSLLPGHGGVLDRIDSLLAAIPVFSLGVLLWL